jgi:pyruvate dehydrogenase E2 component (dihydrolipoamide acetyltransferase)
MPGLSDSMEEGTIVRWLVADGATVSLGDEVVEIETDKATMPLLAEAEGVLHRVAAEGETLPVGSSIGRIEAVGDREPTAVASGDSVVTRVGDVPEPGRGAPTTSNGRSRLKASPVARRVAHERGIDIAGVRATGPGGRIVRADVERHETVTPTSSRAPSASLASEPSVASLNAGSTIIEPTRTQRIISRRMTQTQATVPDFQVSVDTDVTELVALRGSLKAAGVAVSVNDFVVRACALALREHPRINGAYEDERFVFHAPINIGIAVAADDALLVPVITAADTKPLTTIATETSALAAKVRDGTISPTEVSGGTFTISNLGMFAVSSFTAVINPGQAAILAVGAAIDRAVVRDRVLTARSIMNLCLSSDHRIVYGADAARFLADVRRLIETPHALMS